MHTAAHPHRSASAYQSKLRRAWLTSETSPTWLQPRMALWLRSNGSTTAVGQSTSSIATAATAKGTTAAVGQSTGSTATAATATGTAAAVGQSTGSTATAPAKGTTAAGTTEG